MTKTHPTPDILLVEWIDSCGSSGWRPLADIQQEPSRCQTVGWLVSENKEALTLALNRAENHDNVPFGETICIPKIAIKRRTTLRRGKGVR